MKKVENREEAAGVDLEPTTSLLLPCLARSRLMRSERVRVKVRDSVLYLTLEKGKLPLYKLRTKRRRRVEKESQKA